MEQENLNQPTSPTPASDKVKEFGDNVSQVIKEQAQVIEQSASQAVSDFKNQFSSSNATTTAAPNSTSDANAATAADQPVAPQSTTNQFTSSPVTSPLGGALKNSEFKMSALELFGYWIAVYVGSLLTLGLASPWLMCWKFRAIASATYIDGRQLRFDGKGGELFVNWIKWMLFTIFTLGIYGIWASRNMMAWIVEHTHEV